MADAGGAAGGGASRPSLPPVDDTMVDSSDSDDEPESMQFKCIVLGDGAVGKTCVLRRFVDDDFSKSYKQTVGLDFSLKRIALPGDKQVTLQLWDIGGQSIASKMLQTYIRGTHAVVLCYDITNADSFANLLDWLQIVTDTFVAAGEPMPALALMGNKTDISHLRTVKMARHEEFASEHSMLHFLVSAKTGDCVEPAFVRLAARLAGVQLARPDIQVRTRVVKAELVDYEKDDPSAPAAGIPKGAGGGRRCTIM